MRALHRVLNHQRLHCGVSEQTLLRQIGDSVDDSVGVRLRLHDRQSGLPLSERYHRQKKVHVGCTDVGRFGNVLAADRHRVQQ